MACTVTGTFLKPDGSPYLGAVTFIPSAPVPVSGFVVAATSLNIPLDESGAFSTLLEPGNYTVVVDQPQSRPFVISVPMSGTRSINSLISANLTWLMVPEGSGLVAEAPTFDPPEGGFDSPPTVAMLTGTPTGVVHYTTDNTRALPTSPTAPNPLTVPLGTMIRAMTTASGYRDSAESTATYPAIVSSFPTYYGVSSLDVLTPTQVKALNLRPATNPFGTYPMSGSVIDYFYWWWPATFASPALGNGFTLVGSGPMVMAASIGPFVGGPVNGWYYAPMTIDARAGFLFRTYYQLGNGSPQSVLIQ